MNPTAQPIDGLVGAMPAPNFVCSEGHRIFATDVDSLDQCPRVGCKGTLRRVGIGSRSAGAATRSRGVVLFPGRRLGSGTACSQAEQST